MISRFFFYENGVSYSYQKTIPESTLKNRREPVSKVWLTSYKLNSFLSISSLLFYINNRFQSQGKTPTIVPFYCCVRFDFFFCSRQFPSLFESNIILYTFMTSYFCKNFYPFAVYRPNEHFEHLILLQKHFWSGLFQNAIHDLNNFLED